MLVRAIALTTVSALLLAACGADSTNGPTGSALRGLTVTSSNDTVRNTDPIPSGPGYFQGWVIGPSPAGAGNDSLATAPRIAGVIVSVYPNAGSSASPQAGDLAASVTTGADGKFQLPSLPAGNYIVTFVPPANSGYTGVYASGPLNANSHLYYWWIVLPKK